MLTSSTDSRFFFVHYGDDVPTDENFRPGRYFFVAKYLTLQGYDSYLVAPTFSHNRRAQRARIQVASQPVRVRLVATRGYDRSRGIGRLRFLRDMRNGLRQALDDLRKGDIVVAGWPPPGAANVLASMCRTREASFMLDIRDLWPDALLPDISGRGISWLRKGLGVADYYRAFHEAKHVFAISETYAQWARERGATSVSVVPLGAPPRTDPMTRSAEARRRLGLPEDDVIVAFCGSLSAHFDFGNLVDALPISRPDGRRLRVLVAGDGAQLSRLRSQLMGLPVEFFGWVSHGQVRLILAAADAGWAPYRSSATMTLPNKVFEYASYGLPILGRLDRESQAMLGFLGLDYFHTLSSAELRHSLRSLPILEDDVREARVRTYRKHCGRYVLTARFADMLLEWAGFCAR